MRHFKGYVDMRKRFVANELYQAFVFWRQKGKQWTSDRKFAYTWAYVAVPHLRFNPLNVSVMLCCSVLPLNFCPPPPNSLLASYLLWYLRVTIPVVAPYMLYKQK